MPLRSVVKGVGAYLPERVLTNDDLARMVDTNDEWIRQRTGIARRHIAAKDELTSDLGRKAALAALDNAGASVDEIDLIVMATTTPDNTFPATATRLQAKLGVTQGAAFDVQAVCTGFLLSLIHIYRFRARWPRGLEGRLLALAMEDHYLRVHTDAGAGLILCRMRDAERELAAADGRRVHRSYWVARPAVARVERRGRRPVLILENGLEVPVGRSYAAGLRAAGWL